jgi:hypothetical protein
LRKLFFYPAYFLPWFLVLSFYLVFKLPILPKFLYLLFLGGLGFFFRRSYIPYQDTVKSDGEIFLAPVFGQIRSIRKRPNAETEIRISVSTWAPKGLYLPTSGEVSYLKANKGRKISRKAQEIDFYGSFDEVAHTDLRFTSKNLRQTLLRFVDATAGIRPTIWLKSGDRGRGGACFGYYPFGGTLIIYLPSESDILVFEKEKVHPGLTVIAAIKG